MLLTDHGVCLPGGDEELGFQVLGQEGDHATDPKQVDAGLHQHAHVHRRP